jgi:FlaA1/EpsC-like NDP-sugar epimerase
MDAIFPGQEKKSFFLRASRSISYTKQIQIALDLSTLSLAFFSAYVLRMGLAAHFDATPFLVQFFETIVLQGCLLYAFNIYTRVWRYVGLSDLAIFAYFALASIGILLALRLGLPPALGVLRVSGSIAITDGVLAFLGLTSLRLLWRVIHEKYEQGIDRHSPERKGSKVLLVGAGKFGVMAVRELKGSGSQELNVVGFVDDDPRKYSALIHQVPVLGACVALPDLVKQHQVDLVIITIAKISGAQIRRIVDLCEKIPVPVRVIPAYSEILQGNIQYSHIREVKIEDLLRREPVDLDLNSIGKFLTNHRVLITGAGGSIGSELARQVARFNPSSLVLLDKSEAALFEIEQELREKVTSPIVAVVANCANEARMRVVFAEQCPQIILHAAAYKHVLLMELNPFEAIENNALGTRTVAQIAGEFDVESFILVSTDKAVNPTSIMGASKRLAELFVADLCRRFSTRFMVVRFGNVLGSSGSVVPIFKRQIAKGGPVTVTHEEMVRYFMTIPEACQLILQAACTGHGGDLFILDMGEPVRILELAKDMIRLSGFKPYEDIDIVFVGERQGEKLAEELHAGNERATKTTHPRIFHSKLCEVEMPIEDILRRVQTVVAEHDEAKLRALLTWCLAGTQVDLSVVNATGSSHCVSELV